MTQSTVCVYKARDTSEHKASRGAVTRYGIWRAMVKQTASACLVCCIAWSTSCWSIKKRHNRASLPCYAHTVKVECMLIQYLLNVCPYSMCWMYAHTVCIECMLTQYMSNVWCNFWQDETKCCTQRQIQHCVLWCILGLTALKYDLYNEHETQFIRLKPGIHRSSAN